MDVLIQAGGGKKIFWANSSILGEVYWFHVSKSSLTWCKIHSSIPPDLSLIQGLLIQHMERSERVINVVFVCCEEKQRERSQDTRDKTHYHSRDKGGRTWGTCFWIQACRFWWYRWLRGVCATGFTAFSKLMFVWVSLLVFVHSCLFFTDNKTRMPFQVHVCSS